MTTTSNDEEENKSSSWFSSIIGKVFSKSFHFVLSPFILTATFSVGDIVARLLYGYYVDGDKLNKLPAFVDPLHYRPPHLAATTEGRRKWFSLF
jgi:hypothetical protein